MTEPRRYLSFDLEIAKVLPEECVDFNDRRPLGITCAAMAWETDDPARPASFVSHADGDQMSLADVDAMCTFLLEQAAEGFTITGWNTLGFDFDVLAEECSPAMRAPIIDLATSDRHVDGMFHFFCLKGFCIGLDAACRGMGLPGKPEGMTGAEAPKLWKRNEEDDRNKVLRYVHSDAAQQLQLMLAVREARNRIAWITKAGKRADLELGPWLSVPEALRLPDPDVSWMKDPWPRSKFTAWTETPIPEAAT